MMTSYRARVTAYPTEMGFVKDIFTQKLAGWFVLEQVEDSIHKVLSFCIAWMLLMSSNLSRNDGFCFWLFLILPARAEICRTLGISIVFREQLEYKLICISMLLDTTFEAEYRRHLKKLSDGDMAYQNEAVLEAQFGEQLNSQDYSPYPFPTMMLCWLVSKSHLKLVNRNLEYGLYPTEANLTALQEFLPSFSLRRLSEV